MDAEIFKIRKMRHLDEKMEDEAVRIDEEKMTETLIKLNSNMTALYHKQFIDDVDINEFIYRFIDNMYTILDLFNEMGVYPDYFYNVIIKMNIEYKKIVKDNTVRGEYRIFRSTNLSVEAIEAIKEALKEKYYCTKSDPLRDAGDLYYDMIRFFKIFNIPHGISTKEHIVSSFNDINYNISAIMNELTNSDDIFDEIECLTRLLFDYMSFFASIGVNPKPYLDNYIEEKEKTKHL